MGPRVKPIPMVNLYYNILLYLKATKGLLNIFEDLCACSCVSLYKNMPKHKALSPGCIEIPYSPSKQISR